MLHNPYMILHDKYLLPFHLLFQNLFILNEIDFQNFFNLLAHFYN